MAWVDLWACRELLGLVSRDERLFGNRVLEFAERYDGRKRLG